MATTTLTRLSKYSLFPLCRRSQHHLHSTVWADPDRGHSPEIWDRALGWYAMALVDVLSIIPTSHPGNAAILTILRMLAPRIAAAADPTSGVWWLVMTQPGRAKNYFESSGSAMFVYALLKAVRVGYVQDPDTVEVDQQVHE